MNRDERSIAGYDTAPRRRYYESHYPRWVLDVLDGRRCPCCAGLMRGEATERFLHEGCEREGAA